MMYDLGIWEVERREERYSFQNPNEDEIREIDRCKIRVPGREMHEGKIRIVYEQRHWRTDSPENAVKIVHIPKWGLVGIWTKQNLLHRCQIISV